jgi:hypothetical protein
MDIPAAYVPAITLPPLEPKNADIGILFSSKNLNTPKYAVVLAPPPRKDIPIRFIRINIISPLHKKLYHGILTKYNFKVALQQKIVSLMMTTRVVEEFTKYRPEYAKYNFVNDLLNYGNLHESYLKSLPEDIFSTGIQSSYLRLLIYHASKLKELALEVSNNPDLTINSLTQDPFSKDSSYLQQNIILVRFFFSILLVNCLKGTRTSPSEHQKDLLYNLYLNILDFSHPIPILDSDIPFMRLIATYIITFRSKLVNIGEKEYVDDLFANILSRIYSIIEASIYLREG